MKPRRRKPSGPRQPGPVQDPDYRWMEANVLGDDGLLVYGRLAEEIHEAPPEDLWRQLRAVAEPYLAGGADRAAVYQRIVDAALEALGARDQRFGYPPPFCHKGCCQCCHELVYCTSEEARQIQDYCRAEGIAIDPAKLERQLRHVETDARLDHTGGTTWNDQEEADQSCVFLRPEDGACAIWPVRPMVCRVHLAEGTDAHCRPHNGRENPEARGISYLETSYILTAIFTIHRDSIRKTMGRLLLALNQREGGRADPR
jgi:Fe-S-cluster containining protein